VLSRFAFFGFEEAFWQIAAKLSMPMPSFGAKWSF
jgi:hypothetical protein